ncbi:MAG: hypothetical protein AB7F79_10030 [Steroidobacteraceae bacterium]
MRIPALLVSLLAVFATLLAQSANAVQVTSYLHAVPQAQPRTDIGLLFADDALKVNGALITQQLGNQTLITPRVSFNYLLLPNLRLESNASFANWNDGTSAGNNHYETRLVARSLLPMVDEVIGTMRLDADGTLHRKLRFNSSDKLDLLLFSEPLQLNTNAVVEEVANGSATAAIYTTFETALLLSPPTSNVVDRVALRYATESGATKLQHTAAIFSREWQQSELLRLRIEYQLLNNTTNLQNLIKFTWHGSF